MKPKIRTEPNGQRWLLCSSDDSSISELSLPVTVQGRAEVYRKGSRFLQVYGKGQKFPTLSIEFLRSNYAPDLAGNKVKVTIEVL